MSSEEQCLININWLISGELMTRRRSEELRKTDDGSFVFCGFLVISTKIIQRMLRGMHGKSCLLQRQCPHHQKIGWGSQRTEAEDEPWSCHVANGSFPSNFCKTLWVGGEQTRNGTLLFGNWSSPPKFCTSIFEIQFTALRWGIESSLFPTRYPRRKAKGCVLSVWASPVLTEWGHWKCHSSTSKLKHCT